MPKTFLAYAPVSGPVVPSVLPVTGEQAAATTAIPRPATAIEAERRVSVGRSRGRWSMAEEPLGKAESGQGRRQRRKAPGNGRYRWVAPMGLGVSVRVSRIGRCAF